MNYFPQCGQKSEGILEQVSANLFCKGSHSTYFGFMCLCFNYPTCRCNIETAICNIIMIECGCVQVKLHLQYNESRRICSMAAVCWPQFLVNVHVRPELNESWDPHSSFHCVTFYVGEFRLILVSIWATIVLKAPERNRINSICVVCMYVCLCVCMHRHIYTKTHIERN